LVPQQSCPGGKSQGKQEGWAEARRIHLLCGLAEEQVAGGRIIREV
jgi:hypothetical protein